MDHGSFSEHAYNENDYLNVTAPTPLRQQPQKHNSWLKLYLVYKYYICFKNIL